MDDHHLGNLKEGLAAADFKIVEPCIRELNKCLTLRTFLCGYALGLADRELWTTLQTNKVALGLIRRATFSNVTRWFVHIEGTYPEIDQRAKHRNDTGDALRANNHGEGRYNIKLQDTENGVVTRFPPEPSGYLHIGHAKAAFLNDYFAHTAFSGALILRFDDTNPRKEKQEFEDSILHDLQLLGIQVQRVTYTSDYFQQLFELCQQLISDGNAYADDTDLKIQKSDRRNRLPSSRRDRPSSESLAMFEEMRKGTDLGRKHCIRARITYNSSNGAMRDPIIYRFPSWEAGENPQPHHKTGWAWNIYPTYDFACPLVDSIEGVTHALRTTEYSDRNEQYYWFLRILNLRHLYLWDFARINFIRTFLSKRKLSKVVDSRMVEGWDDPRMPTIRGILRRGLTVGALREFMLKQGPSRNVVSMDWTILWALNKKMIDPIAPRHTVVEKQNAVTGIVRGGPDTLRQERRPKHPKNPSLGTKMVVFADQIYIEQADAAELQEGEEITLMSWGNAFVREVSRAEDQLITRLALDLYPQGIPGQTSKKLHWLAADGDGLCEAELWEFDYLLTKDSLAKGDDMDQYLNPLTSTVSDALVGSTFSELVEGDIVQVERKGYFRIDKGVGHGPDGKAVLFKIPTGASG